MLKAILAASAAAAFCLPVTGNVYTASMQCGTAQRDGKMTVTLRVEDQNGKVSNVKKSIDVSKGDSGASKAAALRSKFGGAGTGVTTSGSGATAKFAASSFGAGSGTINRISRRDGTGEADKVHRTKQLAPLGAAGQAPQPGSEWVYVMVEGEPLVGSAPGCGNLLVQVGGATASVPICAGETAEDVMRIAQATLMAQGVNVELYVGLRWKQPAGTPVTYQLEDDSDALGFDVVSNEPLFDE